MHSTSIHLSQLHTAQGAIHLPGSKSISNRALLLAALGSGQVRLRNLLDSDDTRYMRQALAMLGVEMTWSSDYSEVVITGCNGKFQASKKSTLFLGNAGTAMRFLTAALCAAGNGKVELTGDARMQARPIRHLVDALRQAGAKIDYHGEDGFPPLVINGTGLRAGKWQVDGSISSQFLSALLMVAPLTGESVEIEILGKLVSKPYIAMTVQMMANFGVQVEWHEQNLWIAGGQYYQNPALYFIEGDASSASYFLALGALAGKVRVYGVGQDSLQGDVQFAQVLAQMGAKIRYGEVDGEQFIEAEKQQLRGIDLDFNAIPDAAMTIATVALFAEGESWIRNVGNWRVKETDRLAAMTTELRKLGAKVEEGVDYLRIAPLTSNQFRAASIATYNDHRIAMCFALASLAGEGICIQNPSCVNKTFPTFFEEWQRLTTPEH